MIAIPLFAVLGVIAVMVGGPVLAVVSAALVVFYGCAAVLYLFLSPGFRKFAAILALLVALALST